MKFYLFSNFFFRNLILFLSIFNQELFIIYDFIEFLEVGYRV